MDNTAETLVSFTLETRFEMLSEDTVDACKDRLLDTIGCIAAGYNHPIAASSRSFSKKFRMDPSATILGDGVSASPDMAAFANSVGIRILDMNDSYRVKSGGHPSDIVGALFAGAELADSDGEAFLTAMAIGYEIYCSFCDAIDINSKGWDQPVCGVCASALAVGRLINLNHAQLHHALSLALIPNMAMIRTRHGQLSSWKGCAAANAARNGVFAALLAKSGFTGPEMPIEGKHGLWDIVGKFDWNISKNTSPYRVLGSDIKAFPICVHGQTAAWVALELRKKFSAAQVKNIHIETYERAYEMMAMDPSRWSPTTRETADHSLPYVVAVALLKGSIDEEVFAPENLKNEELTDLIGKISVNATPALTALHPKKMPCQITITLKNGRKYSHILECQKGHPDNPMSYEELRSKFKKLFSKFGCTHQADEVARLIKLTDNLPSITPIIKSINRYD